MHALVVKVKILITFLFDIYYRPAVVLHNVYAYFLSLVYSYSSPFLLTFEDVKKLYRDWNKSFGNSFLNFNALDRNKCVGYGKDAVL